MDQDQGTNPGQGTPGVTSSGVGTQPPGGQVQTTGAGTTGSSTGDSTQGEENFLRPRPPDKDLGIGFVGDYSTTVAVPAHPNTTFDEAYFLKMLSGSISLTKNEKKKIVESVAKLSQYQIDELIKIFEEERRKFAELDERHQVKIRELQQKQTEDWKDLEMEKQAVAQKGEEEAAADALRAKLMGGQKTSSEEGDEALKKAA